MEQLICKHFYSDVDSNVISDISFDVFKDYNDLYETLLDIYFEFTTDHGLTLDETNILVYRCGSITTLGEFRIYSNPLPIYLKDVKEMLKND